MRVWLINHYASDPKESASGSRHYSLAHRLHQLGWEPTIIGASVEHNSSKQRLQSDEKFSDTSNGGVAFRWLRTRSYVGNGPARIINMVEFTLALLRRRSLEGLERPDVIIGSTVHPLAAWAASRLAKRLKVPFVFEIRDLWPQTLIDMGKLSQKGFIARAMRQLERHLSARAARIISPLPFAGEYLATIGVDPEKVVWISNGTNVDEFDPSPASDRLSPEFTFLYFGSIGFANGLPAIMTGFARAIALRPDANMRLVFVGNGPEKAELLRLRSQLGLGDLMEFRQAVPKDEIPKVAAAADSLVLNLLDLKIYRYGISLNKLFDYMAAGRPIVMASNSRNNPVRDSGGGVCVAGNDADAIAGGLLRVLDSSSAEREDWSKKASDYVSEHYDYRVLGDRLDSLMREVVDEGTTS
ncbi:glycosyltransferase WbuB [Salinibacterium sp. UTAS2018]|uniref:glycosyltransferase family 4 protein n=1 Tax=Salinibacterium sp. UTAS2018 TaxID=2508880 RepID=UPI00100947DC|nr:glycosyltransferase family 4 protein [Salinibacterium sp. UTAS2018]QAV70545.1 glycosyltransferase WbuB [Salinibacterium sp. UTAS2018]